MNFYLSFTHKKIKKSKLQNTIHSTFCEGIIHSTICEGIIFKFHPPEFVDDIIHSTFCEGIIFKFHPQKKPNIQISMVQFRVRLVKELFIVRFMKEF